MYNAIHVIRHGNKTTSTRKAVNYPENVIHALNLNEVQLGRGHCKGRTIRKVMGGGGGKGKKTEKNSCKGKCQEKKFVQRRR